MLYQQLQEMEQILDEKKEYLKDIECCIGFDGFIDMLFRVVRQRESAGRFSAYEEISDFARRIMDSAGKSSDTEIVLQELKLGGNAPIFANALAQTGMHVNCMGSMGFPAVRAPFDTMHERCNCMTVGNPGHTYAFEFNDGKLMFGHVSDMLTLSWEQVRERVGLENLIRAVADSHLIGLVNWNHIHHMVPIVEGMKREIFSRIRPEELALKYFFFDMADISSRKKEDILCMLQCINSLSGYGRTALGLNENEAQIIHSVLGFDTEGCGMEQIMTDIWTSMKLQLLTVHLQKGAMGIQHGVFHEAEGFFVENPVLTTGGGDNFNCGLCMGLILGLELRQCLLLGCLCSSFYVSRGYSANYSDLINHIRKLGFQAA